MSAQIAGDGGQLRISGPITLATAAELGSAAGQYMNRDLIVDLAAVTEVDSSALSLLFEWQRAATRHNCKVTFRNLPASLASLAELYGVTDLIPAGV